MIVNNIKVNIFHNYVSNIFKIICYIFIYYKKNLFVIYTLYFKNKQRVMRINKSEGNDETSLNASKSCANE